MTQEEKIKDFIASTFMVEFGVDVNDDTNLFDAGLIDSFGFIQLVQFIEKEFKIKLDDELLSVGAISSVNSIADAIKAKTTTQ